MENWISSQSQQIKSMSLSQINTKTFANIHEMRKIFSFRNTSFVFMLLEH